MKRPFLLFLTRFPTLEEVVGGTMVQPFELCHALARAGHRVHVWETQHADGAPRSFHDGRLTAAPLRTQRRGARGLALRLREMRQRLAEAAPGTCFFQQAPSGFVLRRGLIPLPVQLGPSLFRFARRQGLVVWAAIQDISPEWEAMLAANDRGGATTMRVIGELQRLDTRRVLPHATFWTPTSIPQQTGLARRCGLDLARSGLIAPGVNPDLVEGLPPWTPPAPGKPWRVGYIGSCRDTSLHLMREATARFPRDQVQLVLAGVGMRAALGDTEGVEVIDPARYGDYAAVARRVDVWVLAYEHEHMPQFTWELKIPMNLASGRPMIRTGGPGLIGSPWEPYVIQTGTTPDRIAADLRALMDAPAEAAERARAARAAMLAEHTWQARIDGLVEQLEAVVQGAQRG